MRAFVLGGTGFIGGQIIRAALQAGYQVRALRRRHTVGALSDVAHQVEWILGDLEDRDSLISAADGCEVMFHSAAYYPHGSPDVSLAVAYAEGQMARVLETARQARVERLIYTSSLTTIGPPSQPGRLADERDFYAPGSSGSAYYEAKFAMEQMALRASTEGLPVVILLPTAVFGPGDVKPTTGALLIEVAKGRVPIYFDAAINAVDGRDVAAAHISAVDQGRVGERYIVGGHNLTLYQMLTTAALAASVPRPRVKLPSALVAKLLSLAGALPGIDPSDHVRTIRFWQPLSTLKAERELGLAPYPFEQTARDTVGWFCEHGYLKK